MMNEARLKKYKISDVTKVPEANGLFKHFYNYFWIVSPDGEHVYRYNNSSFQCNSNEIITKNILKSCYNGCTIQQLKHVFIEDDHGYYY